MADNVTLNSGTGGETCATDDVLGVQYQKVKLVDGTADSATVIAAGNGTNAGALRVTVASDSTGTVAATQSGTWNVNNVSGTVSLPTGAATAAKQPALGTAGTASADVITVQGIASMTALKTDGSAVTQPVSGTVAVSTINSVAPAFNTGVRGATVQRVTIATDDVVPASQSGTWNIGTVTAVTAISNALPAGTNNIGDVDVLTLPNVTLAAGTNTNEIVGDVAHDGVAAGNPVLIGARASAAAPTDVTADNDVTQLWALRSGALAVQPTMGGVLAVAGNGASGTGVQRVTVANDSTGILAGVTTVTTVTTVSTLTGGGVAHDGADSGNPVKVGAKCSLTLSDDTIVANGDRTDATSDGDGALLVRPQFPLGDLISERVSNTDGASTAFTNFGATAGTRSYIYAYSIFRTDSGTTPIYVDFRDGTAGSILFSVVLPPNGGANMASPVPLFRTTANTALAYDVSAATTTVYISVSGCKSKV